VNLAAKYGTAHIATNPSMLRMITVELINEALSYDPDDIPMNLADLPDNVVVFPPSKTRQ
jgi:hypothetical protein